jgi:transposase-like protein
MTQDPVSEYRCEECGATFDSEVEWERHNRKVHSRYTCQNCREVFNAQEQFEAHNFKMHPEQQKIQR